MAKSNSKSYGAYSYIFTSFRERVRNTNDWRLLIMTLQDAKTTLAKLIKVPNSLKGKICPAEFWRCGEYI